MFYPCVYKKGTEEYKKLEQACAYINKNAHTFFYVDTIYFDYGQNWWWTTIVGDYQVLTPREQENIICNDDIEWECDGIISKILERGW